MSYIKLTKALRTKEQNQSDIKEKGPNYTFSLQSKFSIHCLEADGMWCNNTASTLKGQTWNS